jgi:hypothetical protein
METSSLRFEGIELAFLEEDACFVQEVDGVPLAHLSSAALISSRQHDADLTGGEGVQKDFHRLGDGLCHEDLANTSGAAKQYNHTAPFAVHEVIQVTCC